MVRLLLLSAPAVAALIVAWAVLGGGSEQVRYVQVLGGPTRSGPELSVLLRALRSDAGRPVPLAALALEARLRTGNTSRSVSGTTDASGLLEARFERVETPDRDPWLEVEEVGSARQLAAGPLALGVEAWSAGARRNGGWGSEQRLGELLVSVAAEAGVFAVPFAGRLLVRTRRARAATGAAEPVAVAGAALQLELTGAELLTPLPLPASDARGISQVLLRPLEHAVSVHVTVSEGGQQGGWYGALPIVPGALAVELSEDVLVVRSPVVREQAFLSLVTRSERFAGAVLPLSTQPDGTARAELPLAALWRERVRREPVWAVVSSEFDKRSPGVVGWPLSGDEGAPRFSFDVADRLLLDGRDAASNEVRRERRARRRIAALALLGVGVALGAGFWLEVRGRRPAASALGNGEERVALAPRGWVVGLALGCIVLGLGALGYFGLLER